jgi:hypothetical protein
MTEADWTFVDASPALGIGKYRVFFIETAATADSTNTITLTPGTYGTVVGVDCYDLTTGATEDATWAPSTGVITLGGSSNDNKARFLVVYSYR